jgi:hypothetical protein
MPTSGITEGEGVPPDAVVYSEYWHPGDRDWVVDYHASLGKLIDDLESDLDWKVIQTQQLDGPYSYELIVATNPGDFQGLTGEEVSERLREWFGIDFDDLLSE